MNLTYISTSFMDGRSRIVICAVSTVVSSSAKMKRWNLTITGALNLAFACSVTFVFMQLNNKAYGFTISIHEFADTIPTLWDETVKFVKKNPQYLAQDNALHFITDEPERQLDQPYNMCHFWSNFEIGDLKYVTNKN